MSELSHEGDERTTYEVRVTCGNCNREQTVQIPKGTPIFEHPCSNCGCDMLRRSGWL